MLIDHSNLWVCEINPGVWTFRWKILHILSDNKSAIILAVHTEGILFLLSFKFRWLGNAPKVTQIQNSPLKLSILPAVFSKLQSLPVLHCHEDLWVCLLLQDEKYDNHKKWAYSLNHILSEFFSLRLLCTKGQLSSTATHFCLGGKSIHSPLV